MTLRTKQELLDFIVLNFADNASEDITEQDARTILTDMTDSFTGLVNARFYGVEEDNATETVMNTAGTYESIVSVLSPDSGNVDFTVANCVLTYTGTPTKTFVVATGLSGEKLLSGADNYALKFFKNGTTEIDGRCEAEYTATDHNTLSFVAVVQLSTGNTIEPKMTNVSGGSPPDDIIVENIHTLANEWF